MPRITVLLALILWPLLPSLAHAHRGFGPAELGGPIGTTIGLAVACYWIVMWWPKSKKKDTVRR